MDPPHDDPRKLHEQYVALIDRRVRQICRRYGVADHEASDFVQEVHARLAEDDYRRVRAWTGKSTFPTYLTVVINRLTMDAFDKEWGRRWRPSAWARRNGDTAVRIDALLTRDELTRDQAFKTLTISEKVEISREEFDEIADNIPDRWKRRPVDETEIEDRPDPAPRPDQEFVQREGARELQRALAFLERLLEDLPPEDAVLLRMELEGYSIADIARKTGWPQKSLYPRRDKIRQRLLERLLEEGFTREILEDLGLDFE